jgi:stearoyl-CoA desaturase (delta-9 desaturase)
MAATIWRSSVQRSRFSPRVSRILLPRASAACGGSLALRTSIEPAVVALVRRASTSPAPQNQSKDASHILMPSVSANSNWLLRPISTPEQPATLDRFMDLKRFMVACVYRGGSAPWPIKLPMPVFLLSFHAASVYAAGLLVVQPPSATLLAGGSFMYALLMFGISGGHHRYFSHRSYKTSRAAQFALATIGCLAFQRGPIWWSSHHNYHHQHSDTEHDPHSPVTGSVLWAHCGWYWASAQYDAPLEAYSRTWRKYPELLLLDRLHFVPGLALVGSLYASGGAEAALWGFVVPVTCCWHGIFAIGSVAHGAFGSGTRPFATRGPDQSTNVRWLALLTFGDGWHNNHHAFPWSARHGLSWHEWDLTYAILKGLERAGVVWGLAVPTPEQIERAKANGAIGGADRKHS